jgi:excisionase family DNA binding protein
MAHAAYLRDKALQLRRERKLTIDELAERLALSRSTIYYWVKDIPIPRKPGHGWRTSHQQKGTRAMQQKYRLMREAEYERGLEEYREFLGAATFRDFVVLFLTEGHKRSRNTVSIANSDPALVRLASAWLHRLSRNPVRYSIQYHADQKLNELREFWGEELGIDSSAIRFQRKSNSNRLAGRTWRSRHGVLAVHASDTYLRTRLQAWMDCLRDEWLDSPFDGA